MPLAARIASDLAPTVISSGICLLLCLFAIEALAPITSAARAWRRLLASGVAFGAAASTQPLFEGGPPHPALSPTLLIALGLAIAGGVSSLIALVRCQGVLGVLASGSILGLSAAASQAFLLAGGGTPGAPFDDTPFCAGVAACSALCVAGFLLLKAGRAPWRNDWAAALIATGLIAASAGASAAVGAQFGEASVSPPTLIVFALLLAWRMIRSSTRARAGRGNSPPSPARTRAGTASPRRAPARSTGAPAAALGRPAPPAR